MSFKSAASSFGSVLKRAVVAVWPTAEKLLASYAQARIAREINKASR
jgi:hypothetical protein